MQGFTAVGSSPERTLATILWRGKSLILVSIAAALVAAGVITLATEKTYEARGLLQVTSLSDDALSAQLVGQELAKIYAELLVDTSFLDEVVSRADGALPSAESLRDRIDGRALPETSLIELTVEGSSPEAASALAGQLATAFVGTISDAAQARSERLRLELEASIAELQSQIDPLSQAADLESDPTLAERLDSLRAGRAALIAQLARVLSRDLDGGSGVILTAPPSAESTPVRPRPALIYGAAFLAGVLIGFGLAWLRAQLDRRLYTAREIGELAGAPVLASLPSDRRAGAQAGRRATSNYDRLYTNLAFLADGGPPGVIAFTSPADGPDTSSAIEGLGRAAARAGEQVVLVDGDLQDRRLSISLGMGAEPPHAGASSPWRSAPEDKGAKATRAAQRPGQRSTALEQVLELEPGLSLVATSERQSNSHGVLKRTDSEDTIREFRDAFSLVLVDSPRAPASWMRRLL